MTNQLKLITSQPSGSAAATLTMIRLGLGGLLVWSGTVKVARPHEFLVNVHGYELTGLGLGAAVAAALPWMEWVLGLCLLVGIGLKGALLGLVFSVANASAMARGLEIGCGCFGGGGEERVGVVTLARSLGVFLVAGVGMTMTLCRRVGPIAGSGHGSWGAMIAAR